LFFLLMFFAALSTSISMLESIVARLIERDGTSRPAMTMLAGSLAWLVGLGSAFSFNILSDFKPLYFIELLENATIFRIIDFFTVNVLVMISAFLITVFAGRVMSEQATRDELAIKNETIFRAWRFIMRYPAPLAISAIFILNFFS